MKNKLNLILISIFLVFCFFVFYNSLNNSSTYSPKINGEKKIPIFKARSFNSDNYIDSRSVFKENKYYIVNIWASWCVPCRREHPLLMELSKSKSVNLVGLNYRDNLNNANKFINNLGNPYAQILIDKDGNLAVEFGAYGVPETFLIDKNKKIIKKYVGPINQEILEEIKLITK
jgi:cytochrome c biogenesis protein CcmG/thiol:disulfide interchange protein DsbE|tara:strand:- start:288 stop:809 length:522 start_codon:yes stop_codon:yes gene_type:complete